MTNREYYTNAADRANAFLAHLNGRENWTAEEQEAWLNADCGKPALPCRRPRCAGKACGNFNDPESKWGNPNLPRGCKGGKYPPWEWAAWYIRTFVRKDNCHDNSANHNS